MKIGFAGPIDVELLKDLVEDGTGMPPCHGFPMMAGLVREYWNRGNSVSVFALSSAVIRTKVFSGERFRIHTVPARARLAWCDMFREERRLLKEAMQSDVCDVVHAQWTYEFASAAIATGLAHVVSPQDAMLNILRYMPARSLPHWLAKVVLSSLVVRRARAMTAVSEYIRQYYHRHGHKGEMPLVPNCVDDGETAELRERRCHDGGLVFATILNGWGPRKNGAGALRAFAVYRSSHPAARLLMFGYGHGRDESAEVWARRMGLADGVTFEGNVKHRDLMVRLRTEIDVLVHPAREDACPVAVIEAMSAGVPVVGGLNSGGVASLVDGGGILVDDVDNARRLAEAMEELSKADARRAYGNKGREQVKERHRLSTVATAYLDRLASAIAEQRNGECARN